MYESVSGLADDVDGLGSRRTPIPPELLGAEAAEALVAAVMPAASAIRTANARTAIDRGLAIYATELVIVAT